MSDIYFRADEKLLRTAQLIAVGNPKIHFGRMVTGEKFISDSMREAINQKYAPLSVDMETASIAHVCYANQIPFISIRSITDTPNHSGIENFEINCKKASTIAKDIVLEIMMKLV